MIHDPFSSALKASVTKRGNATAERGNEIPGAEMEKSRASALKDGVTKRGRSRMMLTSILYDFCYDSSPKNYSNE